MTRWEAARQTGITLAFIYLFSWALGRWPYTTMTGISVASIYSTYRNQGKSDA